MRRVIVESPYASSTAQGRKDNITYLRRALRDCLMRGEAPFASHAIYTQAGVLDDKEPAERALGIEAGLVWGRQAEATVVYLDRGVTEGMRQGMLRADAEGRPIERRYLDGVPKESLGPAEIDVDGVVDSKGVRFVGKATRMLDGTWQCLADVGGTLCRVEVTVVLSGRTPDSISG